MRVSIRTRLATLLCAACIAQAAAAAEPAPTEPAPAEPSPTEPSAEQGSEARAAELFQRAKASFSAGDDTTAIALLQRARALSADPRYVFNLGLVYHYAGDCAAARDAFTEYLTLEPHGEGLAEASRALATLQPLCGPLQGQATRAEPEPTPGGPKPSAQERVTASEGGPSTLAWALMAGGAATGVASIALAVVAKGATSDMEHLYRSAAGASVRWDDCSCRREYERLDAQRTRFSTLSWAFGLGALSLLGASTTVWLLDADGPGSVAVSARGELLYQGRF